MALDHTQYEQAVQEYFGQVARYEPAACIFCGKAQEYVELFRKGLMRVVRCRCGFVYNWNQPTQESLDGFYEKSRAMESWAKIKQSEHEDKRQRDKFSWTIEALAGMGISSLLDVGCGTGKFLSLLKERIPNARLKGIDQSQASLDVAKSQNLDVELSTYQEFFAKDDSKWDVISLWGVLEHVKDPIGLLKAMRERSRHVVVCVPNVESEVVRNLWEDCFTFCPQHLWYFSPKTLYWALLFAGFETADVTTIEPETIPILKRQNGFKPYGPLPSWVTYDEEMVAEKSAKTLANNRGYKIIMIGDAA